jgi:hypothetical protein
MSQKHESEIDDRRFPIQGGLTISWNAAEIAYAGYSRLYGTEQSLQRLAERGGFGLQEFVGLVYAARASTSQSARNILREWTAGGLDMVAVLAASDVRTGSATAHQETLRQLAEVTAERDALKRRVEEMEERIQ